MVEYKYIPETLPSDKGVPGEAFQNAYEFISKLTSVSSSMTSGTRLYLSYFNELPSYFEFGFDYELNDNSNEATGTTGDSNEVPIYFKYRSLDKDLKLLQHAITIKVNSKNVIECYSIQKKFKVENNKPHKYIVSFTGIMDKASNEIKNFYKLHFKELELVYEITQKQNSQGILPVWLLRTDSNVNYTLPMFQKN